jgi:hypothetical protein
MSYSADEGADVGLGEGTIVAWSHVVDFEFTGKISIELKPMATASAFEEG